MISDPHEVLGLDYSADAELIRRRYLELVRQFPPEREPKRFSEIRAAYEALRDPIVNLESRIFKQKVALSIEELIVRQRPDVRRKRIPTDLLLSLSR